MLSVWHKADIYRIPIYAPVTLKLQHCLSSCYGFARLFEQLKELAFESDGVDACMQQDLCA